MILELIFLALCKVRQSTALSTTHFLDMLKWWNSNKEASNRNTLYLYIIQIITLPAFVNVVRQMRIIRIDGEQEV